jgi:hypothetical protein
MLSKLDLLRQERADAYVYVVMAAFPWVLGMTDLGTSNLKKCGSQLKERASVELERFVSMFEQYMMTRSEKCSLNGAKEAKEALAIKRGTSDAMDEGSW